VGTRRTRVATLAFLKASLGPPGDLHGLVTVGVRRLVLEDFMEEPEPYHWSCYLAVITEVEKSLLGFEDSGFQDQGQVLGEVA